MTGAVRGVLFDLDDTLLDGVTAWRSGIDRMLMRCAGARVPPDAAFEAWEAAFSEHYPRYLSGELSFEESQSARIRSWANRLAIEVAPGTEAAWFSDFLAGYEAGWRAFADVAPCLNFLSGLRLGVITNGHSDLQRAKLSAIGIAESFDVVIASADVGCAKPDARIFQLAARRLGLPVGECLYVGDQREGDAVGAQTAGMQAVWLNRAASAQADDRRIPEISSLIELRTLLHTSTSQDR